MIEGLILTPLRVIEHPKGDVYHALKSSAPGYQGFGEAYFSTVIKGLIKGWKRHNRLTLNLVVPVGAIHFVVHDDRVDSPSQGQFLDIVIGRKINYSRLTIPEGLWVAFKGLDDFNLLLNIIADEHDPHEADNVDFGDILYSDWGQ
ncbi:MAG: dTDP-4-dehydrorhamnose 3,5-epimerase [Magnetococcales bacterium]|nr:dTDP-4-dehydrorhamnose 3,5-epimerase [Magnetococcales bacterium]